MTFAAVPLAECELGLNHECVIFRHQALRNVSLDTHLSCRAVLKGVEARVTVTGDRCYGIDARCLLLLGRITLGRNSLDFRY
jgi:hypothetical protein